MGEHNPQARNVPPRHARVSFGRRTREGVRRLADDLEEPLCCAPHDGIAVEHGSAAIDDAGKLSCGVENVGETLLVSPGHRGTASRRMQDSECRIDG